MRVRIDEGTADRLLSGAVPPDDAPPGFGGVADVVHRVHRSLDAGHRLPAGAGSVCRPASRRGRRVATAVAAVAMLSTAGVGAARTFTPPPVPAVPPAPAVIEEPVVAVVGTEPGPGAASVTATSAPAPGSPAIPSEGPAEPDASTWVGLDAAATDPTANGADATTTTSTTAPPPEQPAAGAGDQERDEKGKRRPDK